MIVAPRKFSAPAGHAISSPGAISLVALCFVAVLGIVLTSYLAICSRAMNLSNRSFQSSLSQQLAEFGLEEGLRAFNKNDWSNWSSVPSGMTATAWNLDATNKRASRTLTVDASRLGQGASATIKIRLDNYDATQSNAAWSSSVTYRINDLVGYGGIWYRCVQNHGPSQTPANLGNLEYWVPNPIASTWMPNQPYDVDDMVCVSGSWRRCKTVHTSGPSFSATNWTTIPNIYSSINGSTSYLKDEVAYYAPLNTWFHRLSNGPGSDAAGWDYAPISWRWDSTKVFQFNDVVYYGATWYRYINASATSGNATTNATYWENALTGSMSGWSNAGIKYNLGDVVYYSSTNQWYRCILAHTSSASITPSNGTYWSNAPLYSNAWDSGRQYGINDAVSYNGEWYRCLVANNSSNPAANAANWASAANSSCYWDPAGTYSGSSYVSYGGVWYKCSTVPTSGQAPNNTTYWTPTWTNSAGVTTGAPVIYAEASITLPNNPPARTQLRGAINPASLFPNAAAGTGNLTIGSATGTVDSYDSTSGSSYAAQVGTATNYSAVLAAGTTLAINDTTAVKGYLAWPSPAGGISTNTTVWGISSPSSPKLDPAQISRSPYIPQFDILPSGGLVLNWSTVPKGTALPAATTVNIGSPGATMPSRYHYNGNLVIGGGSSIITTLNINGPVILYISGDLTMTGTSPIGIMNINSAGSAEIHVGGILKVDSGSDGIVNKTLDPHALILLCDSAASTIPFYSEGVNPLYGVIYAPKTTATGGLTFNYSNTNTTTLYGAVSAANVTFNNNAIVHYDTSLRSATFGGVDQPYAITEWRDLPVTEQATMP